MEAGILFYYDPIIRLAANSSSTPRCSCPVTADINLLNLQTHMHARGLGGQAFVIRAGPPAPAQSIYESTNWEHVTWRLQPALQIKAGSDPRLPLQLRNTSPHVVQGATTKDEMCMIIGVYYPQATRRPSSAAPTGPTTTSRSPAPGMGKGGTNTCGQALACAQEATTEESSYACLLGACRGATPALDDVAKCFYTTEGVCKKQCKADADPSTCAQTCLQNACGDKVTTCQETGCN